MSSTEIPLPEVEVGLGGLARFTSKLRASNSCLKLNRILQLILRCKIKLQCIELCRVLCRSLSTKSTVQNVLWSLIRTLQSDCYNVRNTEALGTQPTLGHSSKMMADLASNGGLNLTTFTGLPCVSHGSSCMR